MDKMKMETPDFTRVNVEKIAELFPNVVTEAKDEQGNLVRKIDFEKLKQELSSNIINGDESYDFTWVGKKQAMIEANKPINKTLRPCREDSLNWENTENLYIEGDNLEVLKLLQESYLNKVKMIYIDPPYNTGNDSFIYPDDYTTNKDKYDEEVGAIDESGYWMFKNTETNGRFHSSWCSMMYPRLKLARNLLSDDGVIFISIDDNEVTNLRKLCDEVFGEDNFVDCLHWKKKKQPSFLAKHTAKMMEYVLVYAKKEADLEKLSIENLSDATKKVINISNPESLRHFSRGVRVKLGDEGILKAGRYKIKTMEVEYKQDVVYKNGKTVNDVDVLARFSVSQEKISEFIKDNLLFITENNGLRRDVSEEEKQKRKSITDLLLSEYGDNQDSDNEQKLIFGEKYFDYSKPIKLIYNFVKSIICENSDIILDFFSGSATTAHAVMKLNAEDGGKRKFIMVQLPEVCDEKSESYKAGYKNICEIGKERIRRAGKKIVEETGKTDLDIGFRVLKLDESNMKDVYYTPDELSQSDLIDSISNIKEGRSGYDLLYQCMLDWGLELSLPHRMERINNNEVHIVNDGDLIACFDDKIPEETVKQIADLRPLRVVFRDSSFANPAARINVDEIFKLKSPNTTIKVL